MILVKNLKFLSSFNQKFENSVVCFSLKKA